jgi:ribosomal protein S7
MNHAIKLAVALALVLSLASNAAELKPGTAKEWGVCRDGSHSAEPRCSLRNARTGGPDYQAGVEVNACDFP